MNTFCRLALVAALLPVLGVVVSHAQQPPGKNKGPTSKIYLAEVVGSGTIITDGKAFEPRQATAFDAPGTVIETLSESHQAFVYSNGTGMFVDEETRVEINRFVQEPFQPDRNSTMEIEPSISQSDVFVRRGQVGICTGQLISGTTMNYSTPHSTVNIRGGKLSIQVTDAGTTIYLLEGDATVQNTSGESVVLRPGEQAFIPASGTGGITVSPIDHDLMNSLDQMVNVACHAKRTVSFETIERISEEGTPGDETGGEIVARPATPTNPPLNITISPDRLGTEE